MILRRQGQPILLNVQQIWNQAPRQLMTDLIYFNGYWLCIFCEETTAPLTYHSQIRLIYSEEGLEWRSAALLRENGIRFKNPKLSITTDGHLHLIVDGIVSDQKGKEVSRRARVAFSDDGFRWSSFIPILSQNESLWKLVWDRDQAFGVSYSFVEKGMTESKTSLKLYQTENGVDFSLVTHFDIPGDPTEAMIGFVSQGHMLGLFKRTKRGDNYAWVGTSYFPFFSWKWRVAQYHVGEPTFTMQSTGQLWAAGRILGLTPYGVMEKVAIMRFNKDLLDPILILPSGGDTGCPGLVCQEDMLWVSYYSSHEGSTAIYLAKVKLPHF